MSSEALASLLHPADARQQQQAHGRRKRQATRDADEEQSDENENSSRDSGAGTPQEDEWCDDDYDEQKAGDTGERKCAAHTAPPVMHPLPRDQWVDQSASFSSILFASFNDWETLLGTVQQIADGLGFEVTASSKQVDLVSANRVCFNLRSCSDEQNVQHWQKGYSV
jgi:hypothetical protein